MVEQIIQLWNEARGWIIGLGITGATGILGLVGLLIKNLWAKKGDKILLLKQIQELASLKAQLENFLNAVVLDYKDLGTNVKDVVKEVVDVKNTVPVMFELLIATITLSTAPTPLKKQILELVKPLQEKIDLRSTQILEDSLNGFENSTESADKLKTIATEE